MRVIIGYGLLVVIAAILIGLGVLAAYNTDGRRVSRERRKQARARPARKPAIIFRADPPGEK